MGSAPLVLPPYGLHGEWRVRGTNNQTTNTANSKPETTGNAKRSCSELELSDLENSSEYFERCIIIQGANSDTPLSKLFPFVVEKATKCSIGTVSTVAIF